MWETLSIAPCIAQVKLLLDIHYGRGYTESTPQMRFAQPRLAGASSASKGGLMDKQTFDQLMHFVPPTMRAKAVVAGGYAVDAALASDIDIFILGCADLEGDALKVVEYLEGENLDYEHNNGEVYGAMRHLAATVFHAYEGKNVQIIVSGFTTAKALVNSFDLSVHAVALAPATPYAMGITLGTQWTPKGKTIRILRWDTPIETLTRFEKLAVRYRASGDAEELTRLRAKALTERIKRLPSVEDDAA